MFQPCCGPEGQITKATAEVKSLIDFSAAFQKGDHYEPNEYRFNSAQHFTANFTTLMAPV